MARLRRGDLLPRIVRLPPGPASRRVSRAAARYEAPGINALGPQGTTLVWQEALGSNVVDVDGNRYLDLTAGFGVAAIGHRHPEVVGAVRGQAGRLLHGLGDVHSHSLRSRLAREILRSASLRQALVYFAISGSDAIEIALKTALLATGRPGVLAFEPAYHGLTWGALQATSRPEFRQPFAAHFHAHTHRLPFGCPVDQVDRWLRLHPETACLIVEPVVGREGILLPPPGWLVGLRSACDAHGALLVVDEVFTGFGRTGRWFACQHSGIEPDLLCCGKALGGGLPIAAVVGRDDLMAVWRRDGEALHTSTFVAQPLACAAALATLEVLRSERLARRASLLGRRIEETVSPWPAIYATVTEVRGIGLMWGVEIVDEATAHRLVRELLHRGVLALAGGPEGRVLQLLPPLTISDRQLRCALEIVESSIASL